MMPRISNFVREKDLQEFLHEYLPTIFPITIIEEQRILTETQFERAKEMLDGGVSKTEVYHKFSLHKYPELKKRINDYLETI